MLIHIFEKDLHIRFIFFFFVHNNNSSQFNLCCVWCVSVDRWWSLLSTACFGKAILDVVCILLFLHFLFTAFIWGELLLLSVFFLHSVLVHLISQFKAIDNVVRWLCSRLVVTELSTISDLFFKEKKLLKTLGWWTA